MLKYKDKIIHTIINILMFIIIIAIFFIGYNFFQLRVMNKDYSSVFGYTVFEVTTGSMGKAVEKDDVILVHITDKYVIGDIITYKSGKDFITHRIKEINGNYLITKGDSNNTEDAPVPKKMVVGKVTKIFEDFGLWKKIISTPKVTISVLVTILLFGFFFSTKTEPVEKKTRRKKKREERKNKVINVNTESIEVLDLNEEKEDLEII